MNRIRIFNYYTLNDRNDVEIKLRMYENATATREIE